MSRAADYTIKGFLYQFNKSLLVILNSTPGSTITVEGIIEDVEVATPTLTTATQCKYHEASEVFTPSHIFKPLLQMMHHSHANLDASIRYILFAHYPSVKEPPWPTVGKPELQAALDSTNKDFEKYMAALRGNIDLDRFLLRFRLEFGPTYDNLVSEVCAALKANGIPADDIDTLAYPNAIQMIAGISVKHDPKERSLTKEQFVDNLRSIRKTAISRWTLALHSKEKLLAARRKQLKTHLDKNARLRYFLIDAISLDDFQAEIVLFVSDYLDRYHFKPAHICTPVLCLCTSEDEFRDIQHRLYVKSIISNDGYIGGRFEEAMFFREPLSGKSAGLAIKREFSLRLLRWADRGITLNSRKCDDLFIIGTFDCEELETVDVNVECLAASSLKEIKYLIGVSNVYE